MILKPQVIPGAFPFSGGMRILKIRVVESFPASTLPENIDNRTTGGFGPYPSNFFFTIMSEVL